MGNNYPHSNLKLLTGNTFKVGSLFKLKNYASKSVVSSAVHLCKCGQCSASYIGETSRHLNTRVCDDKRISKSTANNF